MFAKAFLIALLVLICSLLANAIIKKYQRVTAAAILVSTLCTLELAAGMLWQRANGENTIFLNAWVLWLLPLPAAALAIRMFWPQGFVRFLDYPLTAALPALPTLGAILNRWLPPLLWTAGLSLLLAALARPVSVSTLKLPPTQGIDIMMVVDASASMANQDFYPNRFAAAQKNAIHFIGKRFNDRIGLVVFAKNATLAAPLTLDHDALQELVASLFIGVVNPNLTAIGDALGVAANHLKNSTAKSKIILLLTDGSNNAGTLDPMLSAKAAAAYGIKVYTIATASPPGTTIFSSREDEIDEGLLMNIAKETGGSFYRAKNELELQEIYDKINQLEKTDFTQAARVSQEDAYAPFLLAGLCLLLLGWSLRKLIFIRVP